jgi:hypothetical protein
MKSCEQRVCQTQQIHLGSIPELGFFSDLMVPNVWGVPEKNGRSVDFRELKIEVVSAYHPDFDLRELSVKSCRICQDFILFDGDYLGARPSAGRGNSIAPSP